MIHQVGIDIETFDGPIHITITPVNQPLPGGDFYATGVYKLTDGTVGMGHIIFDEDMKNWRYDGIGELTYEEAEKVARFIKKYKDPANADPNLLQ